MPPDMVCSALTASAHPVYGVESISQMHAPVGHILLPPRVIAQFNIDYETQELLNGYQ
jgi:hypothetical protein